MNPSPISFVKKPKPPLNRPGVSDEFLATGDVYRVDATEAKHLCGLAEPGIWIPYRTISGKPVATDTLHGYGRLRLTYPREDRKYHQRAGSKPYAYLPHTLNLYSTSTDVVVVEGEFKAASLAEAGIAAVGIGGITSAFSDDGQFVPGLREAIQAPIPKLNRVLFLGDGDTSLIFAFSREAVKIAKKLPDVQVILPRIGLDGPAKGIDDVRADRGEAFPSYWANLVATAEPVSRDDTAEQLALRLLLRESPNAIRAAAGFTP
jgi:hypothetical protein